MADGPDRTSKRQPAHHSALRSIMADAFGKTYTAFETLAAARQHPDSVVIFEGDYAGTIYLTTPVREVGCGEPALRQLLRDIDAACWSDSDTAFVIYEVIPIGAAVAGGMGGGRVLDGLWLHPRVEELGMRDDIQQVLNGGIERIDAGGKRWRQR